MDGSDFKLLVALADAEVGEKADAVRLSNGLALKAQDRNSRELYALLLAEVGNVKEAGDLADAVDRDAPHDTLTQIFNLPVIRAAIQLDETNAEGAIDILHKAEKYAFAFRRNTFDNLYPAYFRGLAYLQLGRGREAAGEFQKLIDHPAVVRINVIGALARLQLGRSEILAGDKAAARRAYQDFLTIWKDADPDIPSSRKPRQSMPGCSSQTIGSLAPLL